MKPEEGQQRSQLTSKFKIRYGYIKLSAMMLLISSEYLFLASPICVSEPVIISSVYPYAAFFGTLLLALTYAAFLLGMPHCEISSWIITEVLSSFALLTVMIWACNVTLCNCDRPLKVFYFLPEIIGLSVSGFLLIHALTWLCRYHPVFNATKTMSKPLLA